MKLLSKLDAAKQMKSFTRVEGSADGNVVDTSKIAEYFNVSVEVASNRGKFLGYLRW